MKKASLFVISLVAAALLAGPAFGAGEPALEDASQFQQVQQVIHLGTLDLTTGKVTKSDRADAEKAPGDILWDATTPSGFFRGQTTPTQEVIDEGDLPDGTVIGGFQVGFVTDSAADVTLRYGFYTGDTFDTVGGPLLTLAGDDAVFDITVTGLLGGGLFGYTLDVVVPSFVITGADLDGDTNTDFSWGFSVIDPGDTVLGIGPFITLPGPDPVGAPGAVDLFDRYDPPFWDPAGAYDGTFFFGGAPFAQFHMRLVEGFVPVTTVPVNSDWALILLLAGLLGTGLFFLSRR